MNQFAPFRFAGVGRATASLAYVAVALLARGSAADEPPREWIDPQTGHRIVRLSDEPGSQSLYFHQYPFSADGRKMVFTTPHGISAVDLETREIEEIVPGPALILLTGRKTGDVYYIQDGHVKAASLDTRAARVVAKLPEQFRFRPSARQLSQWRRGDDPAEQRREPPSIPEGVRRNFGWGNVAVNADETLLVGIGTDPDGTLQPRTAPEGEAAGGRLGPRWASGQPLVMYTIDVATGDVRVIHRSHDWLNHLQCSPTDPGQILFCHEGPWHYVDRTWVIRTDGTGLTLVHPRTMNMEIAGHEFFDPRGDKIWYDLQTPRSMVFWLASRDLKTGARRWYHLEREHWSVHYNVSPDGTLMSGDGGGPSSVANLTANFEKFDPPRNGQWMYLFRPEEGRRNGLGAEGGDLVGTGVLHAERLVDLSQHDYDLEPNGIFTPDGKHLVFRSNMHGAPHVYMAEIAKAERTEP
ncbi:MAG: PD40 domain-containing protein [Pirellulales bacterium]|nr:PD40 domain-containing protein [Pirellulales bacterium]